MRTITLYSCRVRDERTRKWSQASYKMTPEHAQAVYGEGNYELIAGSEQVRESGGDPMQQSAAHWAGPRWKQ
jgi:hypothetical protein